MTSEMLIHVNEQDQFLGYVERELAHNQDKLMQHREVMTLLFSDPEHAHFLMQQRGPEKKLWPNFWTLSATGHVNKDDVNEGDGLGYISAAMREVPEEIDVTPVNLHLVTTKEIKTAKNWAMAGVVVGEYEGVPTPNLEEVSQVRLFDKNSILEIKDQLTPGALTCLVLLGILQHEEKI